jgi:hypothetical protein
LDNGFDIQTSDEQILESTPTFAAQVEVVTFYVEVHSRSSLLIADFLIAAVARDASQFVMLHRAALSFRFAFKPAARQSHPFRQRPDCLWCFAVCGQLHSVLTFMVFLPVSWCIGMDGASFVGMDMPFNTGS